MSATCTEPASPAVTASAVAAAFPDTALGSQNGGPSLEWTVNAYTLTFAVLLLTGAALAPTATALVAVASAAAVALPWKRRAAGSLEPAPAA
jgi:hypothetical protein